MGKTKPNKKKSSKHQKSVLNGVGGVVSKRKMAENATELLAKATILLQTGQADAALPLAQRVLEIAPADSPSALSATNLVGEIYVELGEIDAARQTFLRAVDLDPEGTIPESQGGGAEKFLWLAQLSEQGGADSVRWFERGVAALRHIILSLEQSNRSEDAALLEEKRKKLANALCGVVEIYMTDLS
jgi:tetratricopeptide (TPR) repeat protein